MQKYSFKIEILINPNLYKKHFTLQKIISTNKIRMKGQNRSDVKPGMTVGIVTKENQVSRIITEGEVQDILTKSLFHPHGIKVRLTSGEVGRVKEIIGKPQV